MCSGRLVSKHYFQVLDTLRTLTILASECLLHKRGLPFLDLQNTPFNCSRNLRPHQVSSTLETCKLKTHYELLDIDGLLLSNSMHAIDSWELII